MNDQRVVLTSLSAAMDGGFTAITDVSSAIAVAGAHDDYRLIGGVAVMLHIQRLGLDLALRATGDADFGVPPHVLRQPHLIEAIKDLGYPKVFGRHSRGEGRILTGPGVGNISSPSPPIHRRHATL